MEPLPVRGVPRDAHEPPQRTVDQAVRRPVRGEFVEADVEPGAVYQILADMLRKQNPPAQAGKVGLLRPVGPGKAAPGQQDHIRQEQVDEGFEHVEAADVANAGVVPWRFPQAPPIPEHVHKDAPGVFDVACFALRKIDLRQDFDHPSLASFNNPDVILRTEFAMLEREHGGLPLAFFFVCSFERESLQIAFFVLLQPGQVFVFPNGYRGRRRSGSGAGASTTCPPVVGSGGRHGYSSPAVLSSSASAALSPFASVALSSFGSSVSPVVFL